MGLVDACQTVFFVHTLGQQHAWLPIFGAELVSWLPWALATPLISALARRHPLIHGKTLRGCHTPCSFRRDQRLGGGVVCRAPNAVQSVAPPAVTDIPRNMEYVAPLPGSDISDRLRADLDRTLVMDSRENMALQQTETARLNEQLSRAQLAALRRQMEPHFMFNALNSIAGLVRDQRNDAAVSMIVGLSEFLRRASEDSHRSQVTLAEEVEYLQRYLDIQKVRFGDRLQVSVDIPSELLQAPVPNLLLQPLVENAIKHGIATRIAGGAVRVAGARRDGKLCLSVYNDGPSLPADGRATDTGIGLGNLRTRLRILHGSESDFSLRNSGPGGVEVMVTLPLGEA